MGKILNCEVRIKGKSEQMLEDRSVVMWLQNLYNETHVFINNISSKIRTFFLFATQFVIFKKLFR